MIVGIGGPRADMQPMRIQEVERMLILSRREDGVVRIGDDVVITVIRIDGDKVRLGIEAPKDVPINREEVMGTPRERAGAGRYRDRDEGD